MHQTTANTQGPPGPAARQANAVCAATALDCHQQNSTSMTTKQNRLSDTQPPKACQATATCPQRLCINMQDELLQHGSRPTQHPTHMGKLMQPGSNQHSRLTGYEYPVPSTMQGAQTFTTCLCNRCSGR